MPGVPDPQGRVNVARAMVEAFARRDVDDVLRYMAEDVLIRPSPFISGQGEYRGHEGVRRGITEMMGQLAATGKQLRIVDNAYYVDGDDPDKGLTLARITIQRASGEAFGTDIAYIWTFSGDLLTEVEAWLDTDEGLARLGDPVRVA